MPRPKKVSDEARNVMVRVRFTAAEKSQLKEAAKQRGLTLSDFIRIATVNSAPLFKKATPERAAFIKGLAELGKLGSNLNQIAKHLNTINKTGEPPRLAPELLARAMHGVDMLSDQLLKVFTSVSN